MTYTATAAFDAHAAQYDALRRRLIPPYDAFYGAAVDALQAPGRPIRRVLDLGAGTGALSIRIAAAHPSAHLTLVDGAPAMLERAGEALGERCALHVADLRDPLPEGPFDAVVSALAIHHLVDADKRDLFRRARAALADGGVFVNAEQVAGATAAVDREYREWHRAASAALGTTPQEWAAARERMRFDHCADIATQLGWLRDAGFEQVGCPMHEGCFAVFVAR